MAQLLGDVVFDTHNRPLLAGEAPSATPGASRVVSVRVVNVAQDGDGNYYGDLSTASGGGSSADTIATGNLTAAQPTAGTVVAGGTVSATAGSGQGTWEAQLSGTFSAGTTIAFEITDDAGTTTNWFLTPGLNVTAPNPQPATSISGPGPFIVRGSVSAAQQVRVRASALQGGDNVAVRLVLSAATLGLGSLSTNDGTFAKETGGNLAQLVTNTADLLADGDNLATIATNTSTTATNTGTTATQATSLNTVLGTTTDTAVTGDNNGTIKAALRGLGKILNDIWDSANHLFHANIKQVGGSALALGQAAMAASLPVAIASDQSTVPVLTSAAQTPVAAWGSNANALTASTDYAFKWGGSGTTVVNHVALQNNTASDLNFAFDEAASLGTFVLKAGQLLFMDVKTAAVHLFQAGTPNVNGNTGSNVVIRGWL